jgi:hypothetical protein
MNARYPAGTKPAEFCQLSGESGRGAGRATAATAAATAADQDTRTKVGLDLHLGFLSVFAHECALSGRHECRPDI